MKRVPTILRLALVAAAASSVPACTFAPYLREHDPARLAAAPCFAGDVCPVSFDGFEWMFDTIPGAKH